jgi:hypothetical protein
MRRQLTAFVAALSLALASLPATEVAARDKNSNDTLGIVLGVAALGLLLSQANNGQGINNTRPQYYSGNQHPQYYDDGWQGRGPQMNRRSQAIPERCVMNISTYDGQREVVSARCLERAGFERRLPRECRFDVRTNRGQQLVYGQRCLRNYGIRLDGRRG